VDAEDAASAAELVVYSTKIHLFDTVLAEKRGAHDTRLHSDVQDALCDDRLVHLRRGMEFLPIGIYMSVLRVNVAPHVIFGDCAIGGLHIGGRRIGEQGVEGHQLCVSCSIAGDICGVHASGNDSAFVDQHTADRGLVGFQSQPRLLMKFTH